MPGSADDLRPVLYWKPGCVFCTILKVRLRLGGVGYHAVNIDDDPRAGALVKSVNSGDELTPTVQVGEVFLSNPGLGAVKAAMAAAHP